MINKIELFYELLFSNNGGILDFFYFEAKEKYNINNSIIFDCYIRVLTGELYYKIYDY